MLLLYSIRKYTQYLTITYNGKIFKTNIYKGFPHGSVVKNLPAKQETRVGFLGQEDPWRRKWQPTPVFSPGKSYGQKSLVGHSPWSHKRVRHDLVTKQQQQSKYVSKLENVV